MILIASIVGGLVALVAIVWIVGMSLPQNHTATRTIRLKQTPDSVWQAITDHAGQTQWRAELKKAERLPDVNGHEVWKEYNSMGEMVVETVEFIPPRRLVGKIGPGLPFGGTWTYEITPEASGCALKITEDGEVYNPIFRLVGKFMDPTASMTAYMTGLAKKKFGEEPAFL